MLLPTKLPRSCSYSSSSSTNYSRKVESRSPYVVTGESLRSKASRLLGHNLGHWKADALLSSGSPCETRCTSFGKPVTQASSVRKLPSSTLRPLTTSVAARATSPPRSRPAFLRTSSVRRHSMALAALGDNRCAPPLVRAARRFVRASARRTRRTLRYNGDRFGSFTAPPKTRSSRSPRG